MAQAPKKNKTGKASNGSGSNSRNSSKDGGSTNKAPSSSSSSSSRRQEKQQRRQKNDHNNNKTNKVYIIVGIVVGVLIVTVLVKSSISILNEPRKVPSSVVSSSSSSATNNSDSHRAAVQQDGGAGQQQQKLHDDFLGHAQKLLLAGQMEPALDEIGAAQEVYPQSSDLMVHLGIAHATMDQCEKAIAAYEKTLELISQKYNNTSTRRRGRKMADTDYGYQTQALTWLGVCHRRLGSGSSSSSLSSSLSSSDSSSKDQAHQLALEWLEKSVAHNGRQRENRHHLAVSYLGMGRFVDCVEQLTEILTMGSSSSSLGGGEAAMTSEEVAPKDVDYSLLSQVLSAMEEWSLLVQVLNLCISHTCSFATGSSRGGGYTRLRAQIEYAVALDQAGRHDESRVEMQKAADFIMASSSNQQQMSPDESMQEVHQKAAVFFQGSRQRAQKAAASRATDNSRSEQSQQEKWITISETFQSLSQTGVPAAWSIVHKRHVLGFDWPIPEDLVQKVHQEIEDDKAMALQEQTQHQGSTGFGIQAGATVSHRPSLVSHFTCLTLPVYSLADCNFIAQVQSARLQQQLRRQQTVAIQTYSTGFEPQDYANLQREPEKPLHIGVFSADLRPHPMLNLLRAFLKYASMPLLNVKVTLYHVSSEPSILNEMRRYYRNQDGATTSMILEDVACTKELWHECVEHARRTKVMVWLETTGPTGKHLVANGTVVRPRIGTNYSFPDRFWHSSNSREWTSTGWCGLGRISRIYRQSVNNTIHVRLDCCIHCSRILPILLCLSLFLIHNLCYHDMRRVTDRFTVPPQQENLVNEYPEKMIYVPGSWLIIEPPVGQTPKEIMLTATHNNNSTWRRELREQHGIPVDSFVFGNFGRAWKLNDAVFATWCKIIERVPGSILVMLDDRDRATVDPIPNIQKTWHDDFGLAEDRLVILPPFRRVEHIDALRALLDVALDSVSYSGGATSYDALLAGRPLVTCPGGDKMTQRSAGSVLTAAGLDHLLVGKDLQEYQDIAVRLGLDQSFYSSVQEEVAKAMTSSILFQPQIGIQAMVSGMRQAYQRWRDGLAPATIMADDAELDDDSYMPPPQDERVVVGDFTTASHEQQHDAGEL